MQSTRTLKTLITFPRTTGFEFQV